MVTDPQHMVDDRQGGLHKLAAQNSIPLLCFEEGQDCALKPSSAFAKGDYAAPHG